MNWMNVKTMVALAIVCALSTVSRAMGAAHIEIQSQTGTALAMKFFDANTVQYTMNFTRPTSNDAWIASTTASPGILFGNASPVYAGTALLRSLGITAEEHVRTFDTSIVNSTLDDLTIFKTWEGAAVCLWQEGAITEIWYVGTFVQALLAMVIEYDFDSSCDASVAMCCATVPQPNPPGGQLPNPSTEACGAVVGGGCSANHKAAACSCLQAACDMCEHPAPSTPGPDDCTPAQQEKSDKSCNISSASAACAPQPPPTIPEWLQHLEELLEQFLNGLQQIIDQM